MALAKTAKQKAHLYFARGLSVPEVAASLSREQMFELSESEIHTLQELYAESLRKQAQNQRMILRTQLRDSVVPSVATLKKILSKGLSREELQEGKPLFYPGEKDLLRLQLDAAKTLLAIGSKFADDTLINVFTEKPESDPNAEITFDYVSLIREDGATVLTPTIRKKHLALIDCEKKDEFEELV